MQAAKSFSSLEIAAPPPLLDVSRLDAERCEVHETPFPFLVAREQLPKEAMHDLIADFPHYAGAGFFPYAPGDCGPSVNRLVEGLRSPAFATTLGQRLGIPRLADYPTLVELCRAMNKRHGTVHTDSKSKLATALIYLNETWPAGSAGCLRFLAKPDQFDSPIVPELPPLYGTIAAFRRSDHSFHGHLPYEGERKVIQVAWLVSEAAKARKERLGWWSRFVKWLAGKLDRRIGADRKRDAAHLG